MTEVANSVGAGPETEDPNARATVVARHRIGLAGACGRGREARPGPRLRRPHRRAAPLLPVSGARGAVQGQPVAWTPATVEATEGGWRFHLTSAHGLIAESLLTLLPSHRAATIRTRLTNTLAAPSAPIVGPSALALRLVNMSEAPRLMSSAGGAYTSQYPPYDAFYTRWPVPQPGRGRPLAFGHGPDRRSSSKDLPLLLVAVEVLGSGTVGGGCIAERGPDADQGGLQPGDVVELEVEALGTLRNSIGERHP